MKLARAGAETRLRQLTEELDAIRRAFPDLTTRRGRGSAAVGGKRKPGYRGWSAAQRKAAADRMRKYWAAKRGKK